MIIELLSVLMIKGQKTNRYLSASKGARRNAEMAFKGRQRLVTARSTTGMVGMVGIAGKMVWLFIVYPLIFNLA